jgi:hypothetical protein
MQATHVVIVNNEACEIDGQHIHKIIEALFTKHGTSGVPRVLTLEEAIKENISAMSLKDVLETYKIEGAIVNLPAPIDGKPIQAKLVESDKSSIDSGDNSLIENKTPVVITTQPATPAPIVSGGVSITGAARALADQEAAERAGFSLAPPLYTLGSIVNATGVENAKISRKAFLDTPFVPQACSDFISLIEKEDRKDVLAQKRDIRMSSAGKLVTGAATKDEQRFVMNTDAFGSLCSRFGIGGADYLQKCWPKLRSININEWAKEIEVRENKAIEEFKKAPKKTGRGRKKVVEPDVLNIRTRINSNNPEREIFGIVTDSYTTFDIDRVAMALQKASPSDARGSITYDGRKTRFEVLFHSDVIAEDYVAGEIFKAGVVIKTADDGTGSIKIYPTVWRNLCLNLIIISEAGIPIANIRHIGDVNKLATKFQEGFTESLERLEYFRKAWGFAVNENVAERSDATTTEDIKYLSIEEALPGFFNAMIVRDLVPVRGYRRKEAVQRLVNAYDMDTANTPGVITRSSIVNAITRFAHDDYQPDPWAVDDLQSAAGALLFGRKGKDPDPLPYAPYEEDEDDE